MVILVVLHTPPPLLTALENVAPVVVLVSLHTGPTEDLPYITQEHALPQDVMYSRAGVLQDTP